MRDALLLLGFVAVTACSLDHVVVASLDESRAGSSNAGQFGRAASASAGSGGALVTAGSAGALAVAGSTVESEAGRVSLALGGSGGNGLPQATAGAAGLTTAVLCSCFGQQTEVCGSDGVTYPTECSDAGPCFPPAIACWHACPCADPELNAGAGGSGTTSWVSPTCVSPTACTGNLICM